jgi:hypothetical protein
MAMEVTPCSMAKVNFFWMFADVAFGAAICYIMYVPSFVVYETGKVLQ